MPVAESECRICLLFRYQELGKMYGSGTKTAAYYVKLAATMRKRIEVLKMRNHTWEHFFCCMPHYKVAIQFKKDAKKDKQNAVDMAQQKITETEEQLEKMLTKYVFNASKDLEKEIKRLTFLLSQRKRRLDETLNIGRNKVINAAADGIR